MAVGGQGSYPSLNTVANLIRSIVGDDKAGATGTPGEGQILTNGSVTLQNLMNSAIRDTYRDVRIMGQPTLIKDNVLVLNLPPINSVLGVGAPNPAAQCALQFAGFFDGLVMVPNLLLPGDLIYPLEVWERQSGTNNPFTLMSEVPGGLPSYNQGSYFGRWEWRTDSIWMNGATLSRDIRLRYICTFADLAAPGIDWTQTYVPIMDSQEAIADKVAVRQAARLGGTALADAQLTAKGSIFKLRQQITRDRQKIDYRRPLFSGGASCSGASGASQYLY